MTFKKLQFVFFFCIFIYPLIISDSKAQARTPVKPPSALLSKLSHNIKKSPIRSKALSILIADENQIFYELNANKPFIPASLMKLFVASTLLELLSPALRFTTQFLATKQIKNSILKGDLYLKGGGDASFVSESLWNLVNNLSRTGVKTIMGDLILDDTRFDQKNNNPINKNSHRSYEAPTGSLSFNWNVLNIYVRPAEKIGDPAKIFLDPSSLYFHSIVNKTKTVKADQKKRITIKRKISPSFKESLKITGTIPLRHKEILIYRNIFHPAFWTGWNAIDFMKQRNITLEGDIKRGQTPKKAKVLAEWEGKTLSESLGLMMKHSNNYMVDMLLQNLAIELKDKKKSRSGIELMKNHLKKLGIPEKNYTLIQASGLSQKNRLKAKDLLKILRYWNRNPLQAEFESSLAIAGLDGTLKNLNIRSEIKKRIHAKTGSLKGVKGLAGYLQKASGKKLMFVLIFNGPQKKESEAEKLFIQIFEILYGITI